LAIGTGVAHRLHDAIPATLLLLCLAPRFLTEDPSRRALWPMLLQQNTWHVPVGRPGSQQFENLWRRALLEQSGAEPGATVALHALTGQIIVALARLPTTPTRRDTASVRVRQVVRELSASFFDDWNLDRAAARAGLSRRRFSQLFRHET